MKSNSLLYFKDVDSCHCYHLEVHLNEAKEEGLTEVTLIEAVRDNETNDHIWCGYFGEPEEKQECKKSLCEYCKPRNKNGTGVCEHRGRLWLYGEEKTFKVV